MNELYLSWLEVSARVRYHFHCFALVLTSLFWQSSIHISKIAENRQALHDEVEEERHKSLKHFDELSKAGNGKMIAESKLDDALTAIKKGQENIEAEQVQWAKAKMDLVMAKDEALIAKADTEVWMVKAEQDLARVTFKLKTADVNPALAEKKSTWSEE